MSSETCPFCGKSFKRLKSHLPHCKAAKHLRTPTTQDEVVVSEKTSPPLAQSTKLISPLSEKTITKTMQSKPPSSAKSSPKPKRSKMAVSSPTVQSASKTTPLMSVNISSSLQSPPLSPSVSTSLQTSPKKNKKQKLAKEIKMATLSSSQNVSVSPSPTLCTNLPPSEPKKKDLRTHKEAAKPSPVPEVPQEGTKSAPADLDFLSIPLSPLTDPLISRTLTLTGNQNHSYKDSGNSQLPLSSTDIKLKKAAKVLAVSKDFQGEGSENDGRLNIWVDAEGKGNDLSGREKLWGPDRDTVKLQDIKDTLGRSNTSHESRKSILLDRIKASTFVLTTDILPSKTETSGQETVRLCLPSHPVLYQNDGDSPLTPTVHANHSSISCQSPVKKERHTETNKSEQVYLIQNKDEGSAQPKTTSLPSPQIVPRCDPPVSVVSLAPSLRSPLSTTEGVNMGCHKMGLVSVSPSIPWTLEPPSPSCSAYVTHPCPPPPHALPGRDNTMSASALTRRRLGQVTLRQLPEWLAIKTPSHPKEVVEMFQRGWEWYYRRYINVKKGGVGGVGMLLAGYCVLSYVWSYPHIKHDRWRKYH